MTEEDKGAWANIITGYGIVLTVLALLCGALAWSGVLQSDQVDCAYTTAHRIDAPAKGWTEQNKVLKVCVRRSDGATWREWVDR